MTIQHCEKSLANLANYEEGLRRENLLSPGEEAYIKKRKDYLQSELTRLSENKNVKENKKE